MCDKDQAAEELIRWHFETDPETSVIYRVRGPWDDEPAQPIKLLEVSSATLTTGHVAPFVFGASAEVPFPVSIAVVSPADLKAVEAGSVPLPQDWSLNPADCYYRAQYVRPRRCVVRSNGLRRRKVVRR
jgi:hypothetical protein